MTGMYQTTVWKPGRSFTIVETFKNDGDNAGDAIKVKDDNKVGKEVDHVEVCTSMKTAQETNHYFHVKKKLGLNSKNLK